MKFMINTTKVHWMRGRQQAPRWAWLGQTITVIDLNTINGQNYDKSEWSGKVGKKNRHKKQFFPWLKVSRAKDAGWSTKREIDQKSYVK